MSAGAGSGGGHLLKGMKDFLKLLQSKQNGFDTLLKRVEVVKATPNHCVAAYTVEEGHVNTFGTLHGGMSATLVDVITTTAMVDPCSGAMGNPGVSVDLNMTYLNAALPGDELLVDARVVKRGRRMAFSECDIVRKKDGKIVAKGRHTKYVPS